MRNKSLSAIVLSLVMSSMSFHAFAQDSGAASEPAKKEVEVQKSSTETKSVAAKPGAIKRVQKSSKKHSMKKEKVSEKAPESGAPAPETK